MKISDIRRELKDCAFDPAEAPMKYVIAVGNGAYYEKRATEVFLNLTVETDPEVKQKMRRQIIQLMVLALIGNE